MDVLLLDFKETGTNKNAERYANALQRLRVALTNKWSGNLTNGVNQLHDNALLM